MKQHIEALNQHKFSQFENFIIPLEWAMHDIIEHLDYEELKIGPLDYLTNEAVLVPHKRTAFQLVSYRVHSISIITELITINECTVAYEGEYVRGSANWNLIGLDLQEISMSVFPSKHGWQPSDKYWELHMEDYGETWGLRYV